MMPKNTIDYFHFWFILFCPAHFHSQILYVEMAANHIFGSGDGDQIFPPDPDRYFTLSRCDVRTVDKEVHDLYCDFDVISNIVNEVVTLGRAAKTETRN